MRVLEVNVDDLHSGGVYSLIKNVIEHKPENIKIDIAAIERFENPDNIRYLKGLGSHVYYIGGNGNKWQKQVYVYRNLFRLLRTHRYDYVHIHADVANKLLVSGLAAKKSGVRNIVLHSHAAGVDGNKRSFKLVMHKLCRNKLKSIGTIYVACSDVAARWMFPNVDQNKIIRINNGVDLKKFSFNVETRDKVRNSLNLDNDELLLGHIGRFAYQKNHEFLLSIMKEIEKRNIKAKLLLVGEGPRENEIKDMVKSMSLENRIILYGTSKSVNEFMQAMDVFVLPSHFEGLPIVGVEAQAAGLPCIFSNEITREAGLTSRVQFLPIGEHDEIKWVDAIVELSSLTRENTYRLLSDKKFDIADTIEQFVRLYSGESI